MPFMILILENYSFSSKIRIIEQCVKVLVCVGGLLPNVLGKHYLLSEL